MDKKGEDIQHQYRINFEGLRRFIRNPNISPSAKTLLVNILLYAGIDGVSFPSQEKLSKDLNLSSRHIRSLTRELKSSKLLRWRKGGYGKSNQYTVSEELYFRIDNPSRKSISVNPGSQIPLQNGNPLPTNISQEGNPLSSTVQQLFENTSKKKCNRIDLHVLNNLCSEYPEDWVIDAIKEAGNRNYLYLKPSLISLILGDWKRLGDKPPSKPQFTPCGKNNCENGYIFYADTKTYGECECLQTFNKQRSEWKGKWER